MQVVDLGQIALVAQALHEQSKSGRQWRDQLVDQADFSECKVSSSVQLRCVQVFGSLTGQIDMPGWIQCLSPLARDEARSIFWVRQLAQLAQEQRQVCGERTEVCDT